MKQDTYNLWSLIVSAATAFVVLWYTIVTHRMQKAVSSQSRDLARQIRLSIMPAFAIEFVAVRDTEHGNPNKVMQVHLTNIGNGTAVSVAVQPLAMEHSVQHVGSYRFKEIVKIGQGATMPVEKTEASLPRFTDFEVASKTFVLVVQFQDIEGNRYKQDILMAEGVCRPQPVAALTSAEIDLQDKVFAEQEAVPRISSYR